VTSPAKAQGILLLNKPPEKTSFHLVSVLRKLTNIKKIGHAGTLDPFATGVMVMLIGQNYTRLAETFQNHDKAYRVTITLGIETDSYDRDGKIVATSNHIPTQKDIDDVLAEFQGTIQQLPPMFSAKRHNGKKLYEFARAGQDIKREPKTITVKTTFIEYTYPLLTLDVDCSKGTYIRTIAHDIGQKLTCGAHASKLVRTRSGPFHLQDCIPLPEKDIPFDYREHLRCKP
jgi:tRNA pseudouridine55 synthase